MTDTAGYETITVETDAQGTKGVTLITLNRPKALNALNSQVLTDLTCAFAGYQADATQRRYARGAVDRSRRHRLGNEQQRREYDRFGEDEGGERGILRAGRLDAMGYVRRAPADEHEGAQHEEPVAQHRRGDALRDTRRKQVRGNPCERENCPDDVCVTLPDEL